MKYKTIISKSFNENSSMIKKDMSLDKFNWDSMTKINLITNIDKKYKVTLNYKKFEKLKTFEDLDNLISKSLKNENFVFWWFK